MVYLAEYGQTMVVKTCVLQITCYHILNEEQEEVPFITCRSVHNSRIERLWRDVFQSFTIPYYNIFNHLEDMFEPDVDNELHLFCLHYVYLPKINAILIMFRQAWNSHPMQSENGLTPEQLWLKGTAWYQGQSTFMSSLSYFMLCLSVSSNEQY